MPNSTQNPRDIAAGTKMPQGTNVFADLGLPDPELRLAKADIIVRISAGLAVEGLTDAAAAARLGLTEPKLRSLLRGRLDRFSCDTLVQLLAKLGKRVTLTVTDAA